MLSSHVYGQAASGLISAHEIYVDHGDYADVDNPPCHQGEDNALGLMTDKLVHGTLIIPSLGELAGGFVEETIPALANLVKSSPGDAFSFLAPNRYSTCGMVFAKIPPGTTGVTVRVFAAEGDKRYKECTERAGDFLKCPGPANYSAWLYRRDGDFVGATYKNWSHNRARNGRIELYGTLWPQKHLVVKGECLSKIAEATYGVQNWKKIYRANKKMIGDPDVIFPGQAFSLPAP
jgi:hypothetical protein